MHIVSASKTFENFLKFHKFQNPEYPSPVHTGSLCSHVVQVTAPSDSVKPFFCRYFFNFTTYYFELHKIETHLFYFVSGFVLGQPVR